MFDKVLYRIWSLFLDYTGTRLGVIVFKGLVDQKPVRCTNNFTVLLLGCIDFNIVLGKCVC